MAEPPRTYVLSGHVEPETHTGVYVTCPTCFDHAVCQGSPDTGNTFYYRMPDGTLVELIERPDSKGDHHVYPNGVGR